MITEGEYERPSRLSNFEPIGNIKNYTLTSENAEEKKDDLPEKMYENMLTYSGYYKKRRNAVKVINIIDNKAKIQH